MSGEAEFRVPAEHATDVRLAALAELREAGEWVCSGADDLARLHVARGDDDLVDVRGAAGYLTEVLVIAEQAFEQDGELVLCGDAGTLGNIAEALVAKVLEPRLASEAAVSPLAGEVAERIGAVSESLGWATGEAARLHSLDQAERDTAKAAS